MILCCIDPGIVNFSIYIEKFNHLEIMKLKFQGQKYEQNGVLTTRYKKFLFDNIYGKGEMIYADRVNIDGKGMIDIRVKLTSFLNSIRKYLDLVDGFFSELQLKENDDMKHIEHHYYSYIADIYGNNRVVGSIPANDKYIFNGCEKGMKKYKRKKWAGELGLSILHKRDDRSEFLLLANKKKDDIGDCILFCQTVKIRMFS